MGAKVSTLRFYWIILLFFSSYLGYTQTPVDSLKLKLKNSDSKEKVDLLNQVSKYYEKRIPDSSKVYADRAEKEALKLNYRQGEVAAIKNKGNYYVVIGEFDKAMAEFDRTIEIYQELNDIDGLQKIYNNKGNAYRIQGDYDEALSNFFESLRLSEQEDIKQGIAYASFNIAIIYSIKVGETGQEGLPYFIKALEMCREIDDKLCISYALNNIALMYQASKDYQEALNYFQQSLALKESIDDKDGMAVSLGNISDVHILMGNYPEALEYAKRALDITKEIKDERGIVNGLLDMGKATYLMGDYEEATKLLNEGLAMAKESNSLELMSGSYEHLHDLYLEKKDYKKALDYYLLHTQIKDSIFNETSSKQIAEMRTLYDTEKKEAEISKLNNEKIIGDLKLKKAENLKLFLSFAAFLTFLLAGIAYYAFRQKQKANAFLEERNKLEIENKKRAISLFGQQVSKEVALELLSESFNSESKELFACIMFLDIRNFTKFAQDKKPSEIIKFQNDVFGFMIDSISKNHGIINQFLGDGFMATFGAPVSSGNDCQNAVNAALEILDKLQELSISGAIPPTNVGIGLHAGQIVTGNVGTAERKQYSITGNTVILASRIEQLNRTYNTRLLISKEVWDKLNSDKIDPKHLGEVYLKGRTDPIELISLG